MKKSFMTILTLIKNNIQQPAIQTRRNSKVRSTNCKARNMSLTKQQQNFKNGRIASAMDIDG
jgi:hypothetical protein